MIKKSPAGKASTRDGIVRAAAELLAQQGREAVTTRSVAERAGVQAPTIYRQFGDMRGLLDETVSFGFTTYLEEKTAQEVVDDPVEALRKGWDLHVGFGLANPGFYKLMYGDPRPGAAPTAAREAHQVLKEHVERIARAGRLRVGVERAVEMIHAGGMGVVLSLLSREPEDRDTSLSEATRDAIFEAITTEDIRRETEETRGRERVANHAVALKAVLPGEASELLTPGENALLSEWLDRLS